jgi:hypothetical protein
MEFFVRPYLAAIHLYARTQREGEASPLLTAAALRELVDTGGVVDSSPRKSTLLRGTLQKLLLNVAPKQGGAFQECFSAALAAAEYVAIKEAEVTDAAPPSHASVCRHLLKLNPPRDAGLMLMSSSLRFVPLGTPGFMKSLYVALKRTKEGSLFEECSLGGTTSGAPFADSDPVVSASSAAKGHPASVKNLDVGEEGWWQSVHYTTKKNPQWLQWAFSVAQLIGTVELHWHAVSHCL